MTLLELGGGTNPHPRADIVIDLHHPRLSPPQDATVTPWAVSLVTSDRGVHRTRRGNREYTALSDQSVDEAFCSHFLEHIPHGQPFIDTMNETHRVLKPGGTFTIVLPLVGYTDPHTGEPMSNHIGWQPWSDPTHCSYHWMPESFRYFCGGDFAACADYGIRYWAPLGSWCPPEDYRDGETHSFWTVRNGFEGVARLVKP